MDLNKCQNLFEYKIRCRKVKEPLQILREFLSPLEIIFKHKKYVFLFENIIFSCSYQFQVFIAIIERGVCKYVCLIFHINK